MSCETNVSSSPVTLALFNTNLNFNIDIFLIFAYNKFVRKSEIQNLREVIYMLAEIRGRSQITIPAEIIKKLGICEGDKFEVIEKDGGIFLCPVVVYPKEKLIKIAKLIKNSELDVSNQKEFDTVEDMFTDMGINIDNV